MYVITRARRLLPIAIIGGVLALIAALATAPTDATASDHLDAPGLSSPSGIGELDINDLFVFEGKPGYTTIALTVVPVAGAETRFKAGPANNYSLRIDTDGDAIEDKTYNVRFVDRVRKSRSGEVKSVRQLAFVREANRGAAQSLSARGSVIGAGATNMVMDLRTGGQFFAGLRSDPFFFDLSGFLGTVEGVGEDDLGNNPTDFFVGLNTLAIVLEVPDSELGDGPIGVWATTSQREGTNRRAPWTQVDRMGRPAINTVVNSSGPIVNAPSANKDVFNKGIPSNDAVFTDAVVNALQAFSSLDSEGPYSTAQAEALAGVLLPDILTFDKSSTLPAPLNGRGLADDVIDTELRIVTGGDPLGLFADRDADGGVNGDGVGPHDDYLSVFPYLGHPNR
jgi:hypothetical protein